MGINKVIYNGQVLIDLTSATVTPETLVEGTIAFNSAGEQIIGTLVISGGYTNQVPISIDTDKSIFNGIGYIDGYRLSSSGNLSQQANTVTTGFIPCKSTDTIRMGGVKWRDSEATNVSYTYIAFYDTSFNLLGSLNISSPSGTFSHRGIVGANSSATTDDNGVTTFNIDFTDGSEVAYCRVNGFGNGSDMIVTINEEIK